MHEQITSWLNNDILPQIKQASDAGPVILDFAQKNSLAPAQLEALAQGFNKAATLSWLKQASVEERGKSFELVDVPELIRSYMEVDLNDYAEKKASAPAMAYEEVSFREVCRRITGPATQYDQAPGDPVVLQKTAKVAEKREVVKTVQILEDLQDKVFNAGEDLRRTATKLAFELRRCAVEFPGVEADVLTIQPEAKPAMDSLAGLLKSATRADMEKRANRLADTESSCYKLASTFVTQHAEYVRLREGAEAIAKKAATATEAEVREAMAALSGRRSPPRGSSESIAVAPEQGDSWLLEYPAKVTAPKLPDISEALTGAANDVAKPYNLLMNELQGVMNTRNNDQEFLDASADDDQAAAMLQRLMTTDDVLKEADPEQVAATYNTIRGVAPGIALDPNVMRVTLRSALQHDGMSVFDLKQFLDAQLALQKSQMQDAQLRDSRYGGAGRPKPKLEPAKV